MRHYMEKSSNFVYGKKTANVGLKYVLISIVENNDIKEILHYI